jgi:hypothetical protein
MWVLFVCSGQNMEREGEIETMISDETLEALRQSGSRVRVVRDALAANDLYGEIVAWDAHSVVIRRGNRRLVQLDRNYTFEPVAPGVRKRDD